MVMRAPNLILDEATMPLDDLRDELQQIIDHNVGLERRAEARSRGKQAQVAAQVTAQDAARDTDVELERCAEARSGNQAQAAAQVTAQEAARVAAWEAATDAWWNDIVGMGAYCLISLILGLAARDHPDFRFACIFLCCTIEFVSWFIYGCCFCGCLRRPDQRPD